jgi:hypothetical protein
MTESEGGPVDDDDADASADRRLFERGRETTAAFVACGPGIARVEVAADRIGQYTLAHRCQARDVAANDTHVVAGTTEGAVVDDGDGFERVGDESETVAVGVDDGHAFAATADGRVRRHALGDDDWETVGEVSDPRRFDGALLAAGDGLYRVGKGLDALGIEGVHDCTSGADGPFAATDAGLFRFVDGEWHQEHDAESHAVAASGDRADAVDAEGVLERVDGAWQRFGDVENAPVDLAHGTRLYGVTAEGTLLVETDPDMLTNDRGGWRSHPLGLRNARALAVR